MLEQIVRLLKKNNGYISGEEISRFFKISRAGIWKYMQELRRQGYDIVAVPHLGYRLISSPDKLFPVEIKADLHTKKIGETIVYYDTVSSTMDAAFKLGFEGAKEGTVVCAEHQAKGRGRLGRSWSSPKGRGVYLSIILRPKLSPTDVSLLTLLCAVAVSEAIQEVSGVSALIKWPNDLLVGGRKLVGILTEMSADMDRLKFVVIGIGVNVNATPNHLPDNSTSLKIETSKNISRIEVVQRILEKVEHWYHRFKKEGSSPMIQRWKELSFTLGKHICVSDLGKRTEGKAVDIDQDGGLLIRNGSGVVVKRMTGDVSQLY